MNNGTFDFNLFLKESKETLLNPKSYFSSLPLSGGIAEPLIKAVIYGTLTGILFFLWGVVGMGGAGSTIFGSAVGFMGLIYAIIGTVIGLFIGAVVSLVISSICNGNTDFEANLRVTASLLVVMPISALLGLTMELNFYFGMIVKLVLNLYLIWLGYHALVEALKCKTETVRIVCYVFLALIVLFSVIGMARVSKAERFINKANRDARELLKDINK